MLKIKSLIIYLLLVTSTIMLCASFDGQFYYTLFSKTATLNAKYMYNIFTDDLKNVPIAPVDPDSPEIKKDSYTLGDSSDYILDYKFVLYYLGYMSYPTNGVYDEVFHTALSEYLKSSMVSHQVVLDSTVMALLDNEVIEYKQGQRGEEILKYQQILQSLGYIPDSEGLNGTFGEVTALGVNNYQTDRGLTQTGTLNDVTMADLLSDKKLLDEGKTKEEINESKKPTEQTEETIPQSN